MPPVYPSGGAPTELIMSRPVKTRNRYRMMMATSVRFRVSEIRGMGVLVHLQQLAFLHLVLYQVNALDVAAQLLPQSVGLAAGKESTGA